MTPTAFWMLPDADKAYLIAYQRAKAVIQSYENVLMEREAGRKKPKGQS